VSLSASLLVKANNLLCVGDDDEDNEDDDAELDLEMDEYRTKRMRKGMKRMGL